MENMMLPELLERVAQFGVAGLMGVLWVWERMHSRQGERQLTEAHQRLVGQAESLKVLYGLVRRNTQAIERFERTQAGLSVLLRKAYDEIRKRPDGGAQTGAGDER